MKVHVVFLQDRRRRTAERYFNSISRGLSAAYVGSAVILEATPARGESLPLAGDIEQNAR
jgi:hypothetical protein